MQVACTFSLTAKCCIVFGSDKFKKDVIMDRYLIESPHTAGDCDKVIKEIKMAGYLHHFEWGCKDGIHSAWAIIEAENRDHAKQIVPWMVRDKARIVKLVKFEVADPLHKYPA